MTSIEECKSHNPIEKVVGAIVPLNKKLMGCCPFHAFMGFTLKDFSREQMQIVIQWMMVLYLLIQIILLCILSAVFAINFSRDFLLRGVMLAATGATICADLVLIGFTIHSIRKFRV